MPRFIRSPSSRLRRAAAIALPAAAVSVLLAPETAEAQCSMCRTALEQNPEAAASFNRAILFLLAAPYAVFGTIAGTIAWSRRRHRA